MLEAVGRWFDHFTDTIKAGYYAPLLPHQKHSHAGLPHKPWVMTALGVAGLAGSLITDAIVTLTVGASAVGIAAGAGFAAVAAAGMFGALYLRSKSHAGDTLSEINMAGQRVTGTRRDLYTLHQAQRKIISLTEAFDEVAARVVVDAEVQDIIHDTAAVRARVKVTDPGDSPGRKKVYEFVRPVVQFADAAAPSVPEPVQTLPHRRPIKTLKHQAVSAA